MGLFVYVVRDRLNLVRLEAGESKKKYYQCIINGLKKRANMYTPSLAPETEEEIFKILGIPWQGPHHGACPRCTRRNLSLIYVEIGSIFNKVKLGVLSIASWIISCR